MKKTLLLAVISCIIGLTAGNFVWQLMTGDYQWGLAVERSFFQFVAIVVFGWIVTLNARVSRS